MVEKSGIQIDLKHPCVFAPVVSYVGNGFGMRIADRPRETVKIARQPLDLQNDQRITSCSNASRPRRTARKTLHGHWRGQLSALARLDQRADLTRPWFCFVFRFSTHVDRRLRGI